MTVSKSTIRWICLSLTVCACSFLRPFPLATCAPGAQSTQHQKFRPVNEEPSSRMLRRHQQPLAQLLLLIHQAVAVAAAPASVNQRPDAIAVISAQAKTRQLMKKSLSLRTASVAASYWWVICAQPAEGKKRQRQRKQRGKLLAWHREVLPASNSRALSDKSDENQRGATTQ